MLNLEVINEIHAEMKSYALDHFGIPNGADYPRFTEIISQSEPVAIDCLLCLMMMGLSGKEVADKLKDTKGEEKSQIAAVVTKTAAFGTYAEAMYFGYLVGKRVAEIERLESMARAPETH